LKLVKRRYLAVSLEFDDKLDSYQFMDSVWRAVTELFGEYGASQTSLSLIFYDEKSRLAILRTGHKTLEMVRTALASITRIEKKPAAVHVIAVSGTIKKLRSTVINKADSPATPSA
jgi:RNase P/RNase MRP subunit POP5